MVDYDAVPAHWPISLQSNILRFKGYMGLLYVIHFDRPYKHAKHYLGFTRDLDQRLLKHNAGNGARLMQVIKEAGITYTVHVIGYGDRYEERRLKKHSSTRYCPRCKVKQHEEKQINPT